MRLSSFNLGSRLSSVLALAACIGLGAANAGCIIVSNDPSGPEQIQVDTDSIVETSPGEVVGVYVEYASGGHWNVFTSCDTALSDQDCPFDVFITPEDGDFFSDVLPRDLEGGDELALLDDGSIQLSTNTTFGLQGVTFDADPGAMVEIELRLGGHSAPEYFFVASEGGLLQGANTNPADFIPDVP